MPSERTIGVLTLHRCINYGSYWQARCLVEGLQARGHKAVLVDHDSWRIKRVEWQCGLRPVLPTPVPVRDYFFYGIKICKFLRAGGALPRSPRFALEKPDTMSSFDLVVVGSDEVWNFWHPWYGGCALFFGAGVRSQRLISYAASFGNYEASEGLAPPWVQRLQTFAALSVRDTNSQRLIEAALGFTPDLVLDPCLQFLPQPQGRWHGPRQPFVVVYGHNFSETFSQEVRRWARDRQVSLVSLGYRNAWADRQWLTADPQDFAQSIIRAEAVVTNFFHGCVFALRYARPFVCELSSYRSTKIHNLLTTVGAAHHLVSADTPAVTYSARLDEPLDAGILQRIDSLRRASDAYLEHALS
ncbi:MAG: polysaccharide pyruvyl transferase family protein [Candidatus Tectimicrobiota bacterium]